MTVKLKSILEIKEFNGSKIIAGENGVNNSVTSVTVAEVPDSADWLNSGELVLTTGYFISQNSESQINWINSLINHGASALAIKTDRFLVQISKEIIEIANREKFPIIELPMSITWPVLIEGVMNRISETQKKIINYTSKIHNELTESVVRGKGIIDISDTLSKLVNNTIIVEDVYLNKLSLSTPNKDNKKFDELRKKRFSEEYYKKIRSSKFYKILCYNDFNYSNNQKNYDKKIFFDGIEYVMVPIISNCKLLGFISIGETENKITELDLIALEHGSTVVALELMREEIVKEKTLKEKRRFLNHLINNEKDNKALIYFEEKYNFKLKPSIIYIVVDIHNVKKENEEIFEYNYEEKITKIIKNIVIKEDEGGFFLFEDNKIEILLHKNIENEKKSIKKEINNFCYEIIKSIKKIKCEIDINIGISKIKEREINIEKKYIESSSALEIGKVFLKEDKIYFYEDLGFYQLLFLVDNKSSVANYYNSILGSLLEYDKEKNTQYCELLKSYIKNDSNKADTAKENYIHKSTLTYRLKKIEQILDVDLKNVKDKFNIYLAFVLEKIIK